MPDELVFSVARATATPAIPMSVADAKFHERGHLQESAIGHREMLGSEGMIVTLEFDQWRCSSPAQGHGYQRPLRDDRR